MSNLLYKEIEPNDDLFHKEIIDTFFGKPKKQPVPKETPPPKKHYYLLLLISLVLLIIFSAFFYFAVNLKLLGNKKSASFFNKSYDKILYNGIFDRTLIKTFSFEGDAKEESLFIRNSIKLVNIKNLGWARVIFRTNDYIDFSNANLLISGKSDSGRNTISLALSDIDGRVYEIPYIIFSPKWEWKNIELKNKTDFDLKRVSSISIEFGTSTVGNNNGATIYIKEIGIRKGGTQI